jgi:glycosyltransferase involved in cell wall biosynthesis
MESTKKQTMMRRIAMLSWESLHSVAVGGLAAHVTGLAEALRRLGHEVHIFTRMGDRQSRYDRINGVHYHRCPFDSQCELVTYVHRMGNSFIAELREAERLCGRAFDLVHGHDWLAAKALVQAKNNLGRPTVLTMHSTEFGRCGNALCNGQSSRIRAIEWEGTYVADRIICVSKALRDEVRWLYQVPAEKMTSIYNGVDVRRFDLEINEQAVRKQYAVGVDDPFILFVGRLAWQKGPDILLDAAPAVLHDRATTKFVFVGDGEMRLSLEDRAASAGLSSSIRFLGHRNGRELVALFKSADTVCVPSRNEPFGIVVLEAWSAARPVVVTRNGGPAEFVRDQETGFTVLPERESLGWVIGNALSDKERARQVGRNGRREAEKRFSWDAIAAETVIVYESLWGSEKETTMNARKSPSINPSAGSKRSPRPDVLGSANLPAEVVRRRAHEIYLSRTAAGLSGDAVSDWLQAERELRGQTGRVTA